MAPVTEKDGDASSRLYALLLVAYPRDFRVEYGPLLVQAFNDRRRELAAPDGRSRLTRFWTFVLTDLLSSALSQRTEAIMQRLTPARAMGLAALAGSLVWIAMAVALIREADDLPAVRLLAVTLLLVGLNAIRERSVETSRSRDPLGPEPPHHALLIGASLAFAVAAGVLLGLGALPGGVGVVLFAVAGAALLAALVRWARDPARQTGAGSASVVLGLIAVAASLANVVYPDAWPLIAVSVWMMMIATIVASAAAIRGGPLATPTAAILLVCAVTLLFANSEGWGQWLFLPFGFGWAVAALDLTARDPQPTARASATT